MLRALYDRLVLLAGHPRAIWALGGIAFLDSWVLPCPPELLLLPMIIAAPRRAILSTAVCVAGSALGAVAGHGIGMHLYDDLGKPLLAAFGTADDLERFAMLYADHGIRTLLYTGVTNFPDKVAAVIAGASGVPVLAYAATTLAARILRFGIIAGLVWRFGLPMRDFICRRLRLISR